MAKQKCSVKIRVMEGERIQHLPVIQGRGTGLRPRNRFETIHVEADLEQVEHDEEYLKSLERPVTCYLNDSSHSIITQNDSPDIPYTHGVNPYRGCTHGCIYCYARQTHEYLGFNSGVDFETKIMVKRDAPMLLRHALGARKWQPVTLHFSGVTDCYQPVERQLKLTRGCLEVCAEFRNPACVITKNHLIMRDADVLADLARHDCVGVLISVTTLNNDLAARMEPRTSVPKYRLEAIRTLRNAGVPVGVMVAPIVPALTDHEVPEILKMAADAGASYAGYQVMRLPYSNGMLFEEWLERYYPDRKQKVLNRIKSLRGGKMNDARFGYRMDGEGIWADQIETMFHVAKQKAGIVGHFPALTTEHFRRPGENKQLTLWM